MTEFTKEENRWVRRIQKALNECPSDRLGFYTTGDKDVTIFDKKNGVFLLSKRSTFNGWVVKFLPNIRI